MSSKALETRKRILDSTVSMLEQHGGHDVRMSDIAKASGVSRQAVYLHFATRSELLAAATRHLDERLDLERRLAPSREAKGGTDRLMRYIEFWGAYIPEIYGVGKALMMASDTDAAAAAAWDDRMAAMREGCQAAIDALHADGQLATGWTRRKATDALWAMLLVPTWEALTLECGWSNSEYVRRTKALAIRTFARTIAK